MISAILLCYNQKRFIKEQFQAILKQDYPGEWEIIISDDFSQDGSFECLEEWWKKREKDGVLFSTVTKATGELQGICNVPFIVPGGMDYQV